jgi:hypothetical protein
MRCFAENLTNKGETGRKLASSDLPGACRGEALACWHSTFVKTSAFVKTMADKTTGQILLR